MFGSQCCENLPVLGSSTGEVGSVVDNFGGLKSYIVGPTLSSKAIIFMSDIIGYEAPNLRKLADKVATAGYFVVVPDYFYGDPYVSGIDFNDWLKIHTAEKGFQDTKPVLAALKEKGISVVGAAGFCWGGKVVAELVKYSGVIEAGVMLHPASVTVEDIKEVKVPVCILGGENDTTTPPELVKQFEEILTGKPEVDSFVKIFPGVSHGWTLRFDVNDKAAVAKAEEAHQDMLSWFNKYLLLQFDFYL